MARVDNLRRVLVRVLEGSPAPVAWLAREAGVDHGNLVRARDGTINLSPAVAEALVGALRRWSGTCAKLADELEQAAAEAERKGPGRK